MADTSKIEWTDATWNVVTGCSVKSPGCTNCYAMQLAGTRLSRHPSRAGLTRQVNGNHVWTGEVRFNEQWLDQPLRWRRPRRVFVCAHGDLFHEDVPDEWIDKVFAVMALCPQHTFQILTKRSARMREYMTRLMGMNADQRDAYLEPHAINLTKSVEAIWHLQERDWPLPNVWLGVSIEDRQRLRERAWTLKCVPAAVQFWSVEPLIGDLGQFPDDWLPDWVIAGGESSPDARPMHPDWVRSLRDQCQAAGVPFFFKQWGEWAPVEYFDGWADDFDFRFLDGSERTLGEVNRTAAYLQIGRQEYARVGKKRAGRLLDGREWSEFPSPQGSQGRTAARSCPDGGAGRNSSEDPDADASAQDKTP